MESTRIRPPAVAGLFYPQEPDRLRFEIERLLEPLPADGPVPKAMIVPHAGYVYSGPVAASAYRLLARARGRIRRVVLAGPAHRVYCQGIAVPTTECFRTPLGDVPLDVAAIRELVARGFAQPMDAAHAREHSLEVQLPFLQALLDAFTLVPLVVGDAPPATVDAALEALWGGDETLILVSSDLSHYHEYAHARRLDERTSQAIIRLDAGALGEEDACGRHPVRGLLLAAARHGLVARCLDLRNSGDTAGTRDQVVGYGAFAFE